MTARTFVYGVLTSEPVAPLVGGDNPRVFAKKTMTSSVEEHPYIVYKLGNETSEDISEDTEVSRQFVQVWVHDYHDEQTGDYMRIDVIIAAIKLAFKNVGSAADGIWTSRFLEVSQDLNDDTLNTLFKYIRIQLIKEEQ